MSYLNDPRYSSTPIDLRIARLEANLRDVESAIEGMNGKRGSGPLVKRRSEIVARLVELKAQTS